MSPAVASRSNHERPTQQHKRIGEHMNDKRPDFVPSRNGMQASKPLRKVFPKLSGFVRLVQWIYLALQIRLVTRGQVVGKVRQNPFPSLQLA